MKNNKKSFKNNTKVGIITLSSISAGILALSLGLGLGLGLNSGSSDTYGGTKVINGFSFTDYYSKALQVRNNYGVAAREYFEDKENWNLSYIDDAKDVELVNLVNKKEEAKNSNAMYQMLVYSFSDGDGDGIGDLWGAAKRLSYLRQMGIGSIWLSPIHISPSYHGYDVMDYTSVSEDFGGEDAFDNFLKVAHDQGIKIYLDTVFNHTSAKHPWFAKGVKGGNKYDLYYQFGDTGQEAKNAGYASSRKFFSAFNWHGMPDVRLANPAVLTEFEAVIEYWVKKGVDGFRYDAYKHFFDQGEEIVNGLTGQKIFKGLKVAAQRGAEAIGRTKAGELTDIQFMGEGLGVSFEEMKSYLNYEETTGTTTTFHPALDGAYDPAYFSGKWANIDYDGRDEINKRATELQTEAEKSWTTRKAPFIPYLDNHDTDRWLHAIRAQIASKDITKDQVLSDDDKSLMKSGLLSLSMMPGRPIVYQGNELAYDSRKKNDVYIREPLTWSDETPIEFLDYDIYQGGKTNVLGFGPIKLQGSKEVGFADVAAREKNSVYENLKGFLKARADNPWLAYAKNPLDTLRNGISGITDGGMRKKLSADGNFVDEEIVFFGTDIYLNYTKPAYVTKEVIFEHYLKRDRATSAANDALPANSPDRKVEILFKSGGSDYDPVSKKVTMSRNGTIILKLTRKQ